MVANEVHLRDQMKDYQFRGDALEDMSLFEFVVETYERAKPNDSTATNADEDNNENSNTNVTDGRRLRSVRVPYRDGAGKPKMCRVVRAEGHDTVPRIVGKWPVRNDDPSYRELYCASMALLLKPWRSISELKQTGETFEGNWETYLDALSDRKRRVVDNIQYFHECADSARDRRVSEAETEEAAEGFLFENEADEEEEDDDDEGDDENPYIIQYTEDDVDKARKEKIPMRDQLFASIGVEIATDVNFFREDDEEEIEFGPVAQKAEKEELPVIEQWAKQLHDTTRRQFSELGVVNIASTAASIEPMNNEVSASSEGLQGSENRDSSFHEIPPSIEKAVSENTELQRPKHSWLRTDQRRAHDLIERTLRAELAGGER
jgi:hypothetical protein